MPQQFTCKKLEVQQFVVLTTDGYRPEQVEIMPD